MGYDYQLTIFSHIAHIGMIMLPLLHSFYLQVEGESRPGLSSNCCYPLPPSLHSTVKRWCQGSCVWCVVVVCVVYEYNRIIRGFDDQLLDMWRLRSSVDLLISQGLCGNGSSSLLLLPDAFGGVTAWSEGTNKFFLLILLQILYPLSRYCSVSFLSPAKKISWPILEWVRCRFRWDA